MNVRIRERGAPTTRVLRAHVDRGLGFALARFGARIRSVSVRFSQGRGLRSKEKRCEIEIALLPKRVWVEDTDDDAFAAFDHAVGRASRSVARVLADERVTSQ